MSLTTSPSSVVPAGASAPAGFGVAFGRARRQRGMSRRHLASLAGVDVSYLYRVEVGERRPSPELAVALCDIAGVVGPERVALLDAAGVVTQVRLADAERLCRAVADWLDDAVRCDPAAYQAACAALGRAYDRWSARWGTREAGA